MAEPPVAIVQFTADGGVRFAVGGDGPLRLLIVDEAAPGDRIYEVGERLSAAELAALVPPSAGIGHDGDPRHVALTAAATAARTGGRHLRSVT